MIFELAALAFAAWVGGSGAIRYSGAKDRLSTASLNYHRVLKRVEAAKLQLESRLERLGECADVAFAEVQRANRILEPLNRHSKAAFRVRCDCAEVAVLRRSTDLTSSYSAAKTAAVGTAVGTTLAAGSWTAVSILGTASTGAAIGSLHGAAATNAALAWFGGGSLAAGGGGMLAGKLALVNIVFLPIAVGAGIALNLSATELDSKAQEIEEASTKNLVLATSLETHRHSVAKLIEEMGRDTTILSLAVGRAQKSLFRYGFVSRIFKKLRFVIRGYYYSRNEMTEVEALGRALDKFIARFGKDNRETNTGEKLALALSASASR